MFAIRVFRALIAAHLTLGKWKLLIICELKIAKKSRVRFAHLWFFFTREVRSNTIFLLLFNIPDQHFIQAIVCGMHILLRWSACLCKLHCWLWWVGWVLRLKSDTLATRETDANPNPKGVHSVFAGSSISSPLSFLILVWAQKAFQTAQVFFLKLKPTG